jgi:hypothetical protein
MLHTVSTAEAWRRVDVRMLDVLDEMFHLQKPEMIFPGFVKDTHIKMSYVQKKGVDVK